MCVFVWLGGQWNLFYLASLSTTVSTKYSYLWRALFGLLKCLWMCSLNLGFDLLLSDAMINKKTREKGCLAYGIPSVYCLLSSFQMTTVEWESDLYLRVIWPPFKGGWVLNTLCEQDLPRVLSNFMHAHSICFLKEMCEPTVWMQNLNSSAGHLHFYFGGKPRSASMCLPWFQDNGKGTY